MLHLSDLRRDLDRKISERQVASRQVEEEKGRLQAEEQRERQAREAQKILQDLAQKTQQKAHTQIGAVVSKCLSAVFEEPYELRIEFEQKRGKTEAEFVYYRNGRKVNPATSSGGVKQVAALALRIAAIVLSMPAVRRVVVLDEPFAGLDKENLQKAGRVIESLSKELKIQFIITTHNEHLMIGKVVRV